MWKCYTLRTSYQYVTIWRHNSLSHFSCSKSCPTPVSAVSPRGSEYIYIIIAIFKTVGGSTFQLHPQYQDSFIFFLYLLSLKLLLKQRLIPSSSLHGFNRNFFFTGSSRERKMNESRDPASAGGNPATGLQHFWLYFNLSLPHWQRVTPIPALSKVVNGLMASPGYGHCE